MTTDLKSVEDYIASQPKAVLPLNTLNNAEKSKPHH